MSVPFAEHPKYNGAHPCPKCQGPSHWTALDPAKRTIKIECPVCRGVPDELRQPGYEVAKVVRVKQLETGKK